MTEEVRLSKLMAERGMCSRREADRFIEQGLVYVDGIVISTLGTKVPRSKEITLDLKASTQQSQLITVLINKPPGYVSGLPEKGYESAVMIVNGENRFNQNDPVPQRHGLAPAGRLDIDSTGLIVFTQDGRVARKLIAPNSEIEKEYLIKVEGQITQKKIEKLRYGLELDEKPLKKAKVEQLNACQLRFILIEGKKRQIRRMCELVGLEVTRLTRVRIGKIKLNNLSLGKWRYMKPDETF